MSSGLGWTPETDTCRTIGSELCRILIAVRRHHSAKISLAGQHLHDRSQEDDAHVALALIDPTNFITWTCGQRGRRAPLSNDDIFHFAGSGHGRHAIPHNHMLTAGQDRSMLSNVQRIYSSLVQEARRTIYA
jgi:hypothetical protein